MSTLNLDLDAPIRTTFFVEKGEDPAPRIKQLRMATLTNEFIAFDVETNALHPSDPRDALTSIQVGSEYVAVLLDPTDPVHVAAARDILNDPKYRLTAHNAVFDVIRLVRAGVFDSARDAWSRTFDTFLAAALLHLQAKAGEIPRDLKSLTAAWCGDIAVSKDAKAELKALQKAMGTRGVGSQNWTAYRTVTVDDHGQVHGDPREDNTWAALPRDAEAFQEYCAADVFDSAILAAQLDPIVSGLWPERVAAEHRLARLATEMTLRGFRLDRPETVERHARACAARNEAKEALAAAGVEFSAKGSPLADSVAAVIRTEGVAVPVGKTIDGKPKPELGDRDLVEYGRRGSATALAYRAWKKNSKLVSTYYQHFLNTTGERVHAEISTIEASTGRMASRSPNLQNVPPDARPCLVADPGHVIVSADFSSVEMRVAAAVTEDPKLCTLYRDTMPDSLSAEEAEAWEKAHDPYWLVAQRVWGEGATKADRKLAKILVLGSLYGGGTASLSANTDIAVELGDRVMKGYREEFPVLKTWWRSAMNPNIEDGTPFWTLDSGRFQSIDPSRAWAGLNMMIQGRARDLLCDAMFRCEDAGLGELMLVPIHDEILFQVPEDRAEELVAVIEKAMSCEFKGVPITVEANVLGPKWVEK